jgi:hypothetical protein
VGATVRRVTAVTTVLRAAGVVVAALGWIAPFVFAAGTPLVGWVTAVFATVVPIALAFVFAFTTGVHGAAALAVAGAAAGFFLRANIDPRLEIAAEALLTALLAVSFCAPAELAMLASVPGVLDPGGHG